MKKKLEAEQARLESQLRIAHYQASSLKELLDFALDEAIALTGSKIGYIYFYDDVLREFTLNTWSKGVMDVCAIQEPKTKYHLDLTGVWGEAVRQARPIALNDFESSHPLKKGYPEGHAPLKRFLTIPVFSKNRIVLVIGLANKKKDYSEVDIHQITLLMQSIWQMAERKRFEDALAESQQMLSQVISTIPVRIFWKDMELKYLGCNLLFAQDAGLQSPEDIVGKTDYELSWGKEADRHRADDYRVIDSGLPKINTEELISRTAGEGIWINMNKVPLKDDSGKVIGLLGTYENITPRKLQEQRNARLAAIVESSEVAIIALDRDGKITDWNRGAEKIYGYAESEIVGKAIAILTPSDRQEETSRIIEQLKQGEPIHHYEARRIRKNGELFYISLSVSPVVNSEGKITGYSIIGRDITERKKQQRELEGYRDFMENINEGCFETDLAGNITYVNAIAAKWIGRTPDQVIGLNNRQFTTPKQAGKLYKIFNEIYQTGNPVEIIDYEYFDEQGNIKYQELSVSLIHDAVGKAVGFRGTLREVTERKRVQGALLQSETRYRNLFQYSQAIMLLIDTDTAAIVDANLAACYYYRYTKDELLQKKMTEINAMTEDELQDEMVTAKLEHRSHFYFKHRLANGEIHPVEVFSGPIEIGGKHLLYSIIHDITERREAEDALRRSEEKYRSILEAMEEGLFENDLKGNYTFVNDAACRLMGYARDEMIGMNYRKILSPDTAKYMSEVFHRMYETGKPEFLLDYEAIRKDESVRILQTNTAFIRDQSGEIIGFRALVRDITESKKAEEALRKSEEKYRSILENISEGYFESNPRGEITFVNDAACDMLGYAREELLNHNSRLFTSSETQKAIEKVFKQTYATGVAAILFDYEIIRKDGSVRVHQANVSLMKDSSGNKIGFSSVSRDVTERKQAEENLRRSEEKHRNILENIIEGYIEHDLEGNFLFVNDAACTMMGYPRDDLIGMNYRQLASPETAKAMQEVSIKIIATGISRRLLDYELIRKDGTRRIHQHNLSVIKDRFGKPSGIRIMARDVTELKQAEEALRQSEERIRALFSNIPVPTLVWKAQNNKLTLAEFNGAAVEFTRGNIVRFIGKTADECYANMPQIPEDIRQCLMSRSTIERNFWYRMDEESERKYVIVKYAYTPPDSVLMHVNDITGQKKAEDNLKYISIHDSLTGLYNRFYSDAEIDRIVSSRLRPVSFIVIDLNDLKMVNDRYGHAAGDLYIKDAAVLLRQTFRPEDIVARIGGDEFIVMLPAVDENTCAQAMDRLKENLEQFNRQAEHPLSLSAGSATAHMGDDILYLIKEADRRMYQEKASMKAASGNGIKTD